MNDGIDWSVFDGEPENSVHCLCGQVYRSHTKLKAKPGGGFDHYSQKPCPGCGASLNGMRKVSSDPELMTLK